MDEANGFSSQQDDEVGRDRAGRRWSSSADRTTSWRAGSGERQRTRAAPGRHGPARAGPHRHDLRSAGAAGTRSARAATSRRTGVCPFVAAAKITGVWRDGHAADGGPDWGDETTPNPRCFEFAVCFDVCSMEAGAERAAGGRAGRAGHRASPPYARRLMRLLSWNVAGRQGRALAAQVEKVVDAKPDVVALQEITAKTYGAWVDGLLERRLLGGQHDRPARGALSGPDQAQELQPDCDHRPDRAPARADLAGPRGGGRRVPGEAPRGADRVRRRERSTSTTPTCRPARAAGSSSRRRSRRSCAASTSPRRSRRSCAATSTRRFARTTTA